MADELTILVTGCCGLIGSRFCEWISENHPNVQIIGIDDLSGGYIENIDRRKIQFHKLDLVTADLSLIFAQGIDIVWHYSCYAAEGLSPFIRKFNYQNNLVATANVINNCIKYNVKRLVFTSSMAVYGNQTPPFDERMIPQPIDPYGIAKYACEMDIKVAGDQHGLDWCIIRPHNIFGRGQNLWDPYRNFLGIAMYKYLNDMPILIYGDGNQLRAFSYIDDSLPCLWNAGVNPKASKEIINLGGITETSIKDAAKILIDVMGGGIVKFEEPRHEVKQAFSTYKKSVDILGFEHKTDLKTGLTKMWEWAKIQPMKDRFIWDEYEISEKLYSYWKKSELCGVVTNVTKA